MSEPAISITMMRHALQYAQKGWYVFPVHTMREGRCSCGRNCGRPGKHPWTQNGWKDATLSSELIEVWWRAHPDANIGVACGPSGLLVVDVDPRNNGDETFADLEIRHGALPPTRTSCTGGGGQHYFFDVAGVDGKFKGRVLGQGIELQAAGQYVVVPPSTHLSGRCYGWDAGQPEEVASPPAWLVDEPMRQSRLPETLGSPLDCILGVAFVAAAMYDTRPIGADRMLVQCPWESDHSQGERFDGSTIVFGPMRGSRWGWFHCSHAHCKERLAGLRGVAKMHEVLRGLPEEAAKHAQERVRGAERELRKVVRAEWETSLVWDTKGEKLVESAGNLCLLFENIPEWTGTLAYDESKDRMFWTKRPPEIPGLRVPEANAEISEHDWMYVAHWFSIARRANFRKETAAEVMVASGHKNAHNTLVDYISGIRWDGKPRISRWLTEYLGAEDSETNRRIGRLWLVSGIARALAPGCQCDHTLVFEGAQGAGKTSVFRVLGGEWYLGGLPRLDDKDARHILSGAWIVELKELASLKGAAREKVKAYLDETHDQFRPPYGRQFVKRGRRCVFGASTNEGEYIDDPTGARRFWPVRIQVADVDGLRSVRDQLWAEAREAYLNEERWWFERGDATGDAVTEAQAARTVDDPWQAKLALYVKHRDELSSADALTHLGIEIGRQTPRDSTRISGILGAMGFERRRVTEEGPDARRVWRYVRRRG